MTGPWIWPTPPLVANDAAPGGALNEEDEDDVEEKEEEEEEDKDEDIPL